MINHRGICLRALKARPCRSLPFQSYHGKPDALLLRSATTRLPYSTTGYGDGEGDPRGQDPAAQGVNRRSRDLEHPGPSQHKKKPSDAESSNQSKTSSEKGDDASRSAKENPNKPRTRVKQGLNQTG